MSDRDSGTEAVVSVDDVEAAVGQGSTDIEISGQHVQDRSSETARQSY